MLKGQVRNKIVWAVDITQNPDDAKNIVAELKTWAKHLNCDIQPVAVVSKSFLNLPLELSYPWQESFEEAVTKLLNSYLKKTNLKDFLDPDLIFAPWISTRKMAETLAKYAKTNKAMLIFAHTRAKKAPYPFRFGGFAEALVASTQIPVLLLNPTASVSIKIPKILFPTDFTQKSKNILIKIKPWAKAFNSKILLYNQIEIPNIYPLNMYDSWQHLTLNIEPMVKALEKSHTEKAQKWSRLLSPQKIRSSAIISIQQKNISNAIIETAEKNKAGLIVVATHSGAFIQSILGSIARDVLMLAKCPVVIFHSSL